MEAVELVEHYGKAVLSGNAALFVGAGLSQAAPARLPGWRSLLKELQERCDIPDQPDLALVAEYIENDRANGDRSTLLTHVLKQITGQSARPTPSHELLARLNVSEIWTTNYDRLLEQAVSDAAVAIEDDDIRHIASHHRTIIKMHGSIRADLSGWAGPPPVVTRSDYENYDLLRPRTWNVLRASYLSRAFLFLGFSFTDPNVEILLRLARTMGTAETDQHAAVIRRPGSDEGEKVRLHELRTADLERSGVHVCEINDHDEIQLILRHLVRRTRPARLFISGHTGLWSSIPENDEQLVAGWCTAVAETLVDETDWHIASLGSTAGWATIGDIGRTRRTRIGSDPALLTLYFRKNCQPPERLQHWFGTAVFTDGSREDVVSSVLDNCRALLAIGGDERTEGDILLAHSRSVGVIPLAAAGGAAHRYWSAHREDPPELGWRPTDHATWERLNDPDKAVAAEAAHQLVKQAMYQHER